MAHIPRIIGGFVFSIMAAWSERESIEDSEDDRVITELERGDRLSGEPKMVAILDCLSQCIITKQLTEPSLEVLWVEQVNKTHGGRKQNHIGTRPELHVYLRQTVIIKLRLSDQGGSRTF